MRTRIISGLICVAALIYVLIYMSEQWLGFVVALIASIAYFEFSKAVSNGKNNIIPGVFGLLMGLSLMFVPEKYVVSVLAAGILVFLSLTVFFHKKVLFKDAAGLYFGAIYIFALFKYIYLVRMEEFGKFIVFAIFIGAFLTDTGAYFAGTFFGKHKLCPEISPKKTIEGAIGGIVTTVVAFVVYGFIGKEFFGYNLSIINAVITGLILSIISQIGDLSASVIKRELGIKDYGNIMPGHGGALDRFDSVLFVAPVFYWLNQILPIIVIK